MDSSVRDLRARANRLMPVDRQRFRRRLAGAERTTRPGRRQEILATIAKDLEEAETRAARRRARLPARIAYPDDLPIIEHRAELLAAIEAHQVVVVAGETGSGKTTQLPKLCLELGRGVTGYIGHTQPRRIAARSIAERLAEELGTSLGETVGHTVRFSDTVADDTLVKVMTDGILLAEIHGDRRLLQYDTIILDEAHERSLNIDFLLGYLRALLGRRRDLKLIITSATIDTARFAAHFGDAPVVEVSGRGYPVEIRYRPLDDPARDEPRDQPQGICDAVLELIGEGNGDILVFCSGEREIRDAADALGELDLRHTEILPLYARLSAAEQHRVFEPHTGRRIVLATNVAETSLTVPGIRYVVDPGTARISRYSRRTKVQRLPIEPVSRASADQRAGRCGRLGPGICIRLYDEHDYLSRPEFTEPEIQRTQLAAVILQMAALGLGDVEEFPFLDPPDSRSIRDGTALLEELGAIVPDGRTDVGKLTDVGRQLAQLPIDLRLGRMLIEAARLGCLSEVLIIASALAIQDPRERPTGKETHADQLHARHADPDSDFATWLNLWNYLRDQRRGRSSSAFRRLCRDEYLNHRRIREWQDIRAQLRDTCDELGFVRNRKPAGSEAVHRAVLAGLLSHVGTKDPEGFEYRGTRGSRFSINPGSTLFKRAPRWVMAAELVETSRLWARQVAPVRPEVIEEAAGHLVKRSYSDPWWDADRGSAVARETVTLYGLPLHSDRTVQYGRIDPSGARDLFIRHALIAGEWASPHAFVDHNRSVMAEALAMEERFRRYDLLVDDDAVVAFFDLRIPADITDVRRFDRWWKDARTENPHRLDLSIDDLLDPQAAPVDPDAFPEVWHYGDVALPLSYEHSAGPGDGVTMDIPLADLERIDPAVFDWNVPGLRVELVTSLLRGLPKRLRKALAPIPDTALSILACAEPARDGLVAHLRREVERRTDSAVPRDAFDLDSLAAHLRPRFRVLGRDGALVAEGHDLEALKETLREQARGVVSDRAHPLERSGVTAWDFGELPREIAIEGTGGPVSAYPALVEEDGGIGVRLLATAAEQATAMWAGTRALLAAQLPSPAKLLRPFATGASRLLLTAAPHADVAEWMDDCARCALDDIIARSGGPAWDATAFDALLARARGELAGRVEDIARRSLTVLESLREVRGSLAGVDADLFPDVVADISIQLERLIYPGFVAGVGAGRVADVDRYLQAIVRRLARLPEDPDRDAARMATVGRLEAEHDGLYDTHGGSAEFIDVGWMLQELRVSLFAQALGTREKVSETRIRRALDDLRRR